MINKILVPPCAYQGGKQRVAKQIVDIILKDNPKLLNDDNDTYFYDLCCGSGAISIELINRGFNPNNLVMVDKSPWGLFYKLIGDGTFSTEVFKFYIDDIPKDISKIQEHIKFLSTGTAYDTQIDLAYIFLLLQASAFGSKSIWIKDNKWQNTSFRSYWLPTKTSSRRSPVNPMMPMPNTLFERVEEIAYQMDGVEGYYADVNDIKIKDNAIVYIDPPYKGTTQYGYNFDYMEYIRTIKNKIYLSEGIKLSDKAYQITSNRKKGGISGDRKSKNEEWLNIFNDTLNQ